MWTVKKECADAVHDFLSDAMVADYKLAKEAFVSDTTGSSIGHINAVSLAALVSERTWRKKKHGLT